MRFVALLVLFAISNSASASDSTESLEAAQFDQPSVMSSTVIPKRGLGATGSIREMGQNFGLLFQKPISERFVSWSSVTFASATTLMTDQLDDHKRNGIYERILHIDQNNRAALLTGIDYLLPLNQRHSWSLIGGVGFALARSEMHLTSYPRVCSLWCGSDLDRPFTDSTVDIALLSFIRFGLKVSDMKFGSQRGDFSIVIMGQPIRYPKYVKLATLEEGTKEINPDPGGFFQAETVFHF